MAIKLESLSPAELQALIAQAQSQMQIARSNHIKEARAKIEKVLADSGLTLSDVYPVRGGQGAKGSKRAVAPKYRNPENPAQTWSGRGKRPVWFNEALKKKGVTADSLLIQSAPKAASAKKVPAKAVRKARSKKN